MVARRHRRPIECGHAGVASLDHRFRVVTSKMKAILRVSLVHGLLAILASGEASAGMLYARTS